MLEDSPLGRETPTGTALAGLATGDPNDLAAALTKASWWDLVEARAARSPDLPMLVDNYDRHLTFGEYRDLAERVAAGLAGRGVHAGTVVSWQLPTTIEAAVLLGALARLGCVQNPVIPVLREAEVDFISGQIGTGLLVVPDVFRGYDHAAMAARVAQRHGVDVLVVPGSPKADLGSLPLPLGDPGTLPRAADPAAAGQPARWAFYSSGTTGVPKGVRHTDASVLAQSNALVAQLGFDSSDVISIAFPITHIGALGQLGLALRTGCKVILIDIFEPIASSAVLGRHGSTMLGSATPHFHAYLAAQRAHGTERLFPRLRFAINGGAPPEPGMHERIRAELGGAGAVNGWGLTEFPMAGFGTPSDPEQRLSTGASRPGPGVRVRVVGADEREVPPGAEGELRVTGPQLFAGYVDAALDAGAFDEAGYLRTGDLGIVDADGWLYVTGRIKDIIVRNAENISALEVENALLGHPAIEDVAVVGIPDPRTGERAVAFVVPAVGAPAPSLAEVAAFCRETGLATYKIPERLEVVDALPRNAMGKLLKNELRARIVPRAVAAAR